MSFILDALRRTDRDRKSGINPNLESVVELAPKAPARHRSHWLAAAAIVALGAGAAALLLWPQSSQQTPQPVMAAARSAPSVPPGSTPTASPPLSPPPAGPNEMVRAPRRMDPAPTAASRAAPEAARTQGPTGVPLDGSLSAAVQRRRLSQVRPDRDVPHGGVTDPPGSEYPGTPNPTMAAPPTAAAVQAELPRPAARKIVPPSGAGVAAEAATPAPLRSDGPAPETPALAAAEPVAVEPVAAEAMVIESTAPSIAPVTAGPAPSSRSEVPLREVPLADVLPPIQRQLFDGIRLDAHVYADDPAERFVLIHMRGHRVGDTVGPSDAVIEAITPEGAVMRSGSVRALIPHP